MMNTHASEYVQKHTLNFVIEPILRIEIRYLFLISSYHNFRKNVIPFKTN